LRYSNTLGDYRRQAGPGSSEVGCIPD